MKRVLHLVPFKNITILVTFQILICWFGLQEGGGVPLQIKFSLVFMGVAMLMEIDNINGQSFAAHTKILKMPMTKVGMMMTMIMMMLMMTSWKWKVDESEGVANILILCYCWLTLSQKEPISSVSSLYWWWWKWKWWWWHIWMVIIYFDYFGWLYRRKNQSHQSPHTHV